MMKLNRIFHCKRMFPWSIVLLGLFLSSCSFPGIVSTSEQLPQVTVTPQPALQPVHFPRDEGAHNNLTEWWYYTGHLEAADVAGNQHQYGFEMVIFQALRSDFQPVYAAHFAISDITHDTFHYDQRSVNAPTDPDVTSTNGIAERVGDWTIQGLNGHDHLAATMKNYAINLQLTGLKPASLHKGGPVDGSIAYGPGSFSYYYSRTHMDVTGTIQDHNQTLQVTSGLAWMDHQWGNFLPLGGEWDWYSIQLNDNTEMMLYFIHDASGVVSTAYADLIDPSANDNVIQQTVLHLTQLATWTSPTTGITYPSGWRIDINAPQIQATLTLQPLLKNQELVTTASTDNIYWEGAVGIQGQRNGSPIAGQGYVELTGYSKK